MSFRQVVTDKILPSAAHITGGVSSGWGVWDRHEADCLIKVTAKSGSSPTLDVFIEISDNDADWYPHTTFPTITDIGNYSRAVTNFGKYVRARYVIGGGTPSLTFEIKFMAKN